MSDKNKTKVQLIEEMAVLRERNAELEAREAEYQHTVQIQAALYRIADAASAVEDMQEFYATIHQIVGELMYAENFFIALYDAERQQMRFAYMVDTIDGSIDSQKWFPLSFGGTGYVLRTGQPILNIEQYNQLVQAGEIDATNTGSRNFDGANIPLKVEGRVIGTLAIQSYIEGIGYTDQDREILVFVAQHIATALERARLLDDTRQRNAELAIINSVGEGLAKQLEFQAIIDLVGDKIRDIFQVHTVAVGFLDPETNLINIPYLLNLGQRQSLEPLPFGEGLASHVIRSGEPLVINQDAKRRFAEYGTEYPDDEDGNSIKSWAGVPIMVGDKAIGGIGLQDTKENAFSEADVRLLSTIAANMGVAIENARLFDELQTRNREIAEALQQQTATGEILRAMAGSLNDVQPVFDAIAKNAANLAGTAVSNVYRYDGQLLHVVAMHNLPPENMAAVRKAYPRPLTRDVGLSAMSIIDGTAYNVADVEQDPRVPPHMVKLTLDAGMRSALFVPMIRQGVVIGAIGILRREAGAFSEKQVALLNTFADQAIIAIENVELFNETKRLLAESEEQVTELSTLNIISEGLVGQLDLQGIVDLVGDKIREIMEEKDLGIGLYDVENNLINVAYNVIQGRRLRPASLPFGQGLVSVVIRSGQPLVLDTHQEMVDHGAARHPDREEDTPSHESWLGVPILVGQDVRGVIFIRSREKYAFSQADARLLTTIAANMGVAIENARLFERIQQTNQELSQTLEELKSTQGQLVEAEKMAALGGLVAGVAHEINTPVGVGVTAASTLQDKTTSFSEIYRSGQMKRSDLEKYLDIAEQSSAMILRNLERAAELIRSFKQVAVDQSSEERREFPVKAYLAEILLSLRPQLKKTQHTVEINGDDGLTLDSYPGAFSQIVTNLVMNSLLHAYGPDEWGQLTFDFKQNDGRLIFEYNDDGKGIPAENLSKIFEPFFTTKRTQGGSGLGLHIIYNLVTQRLGGTINCESNLGSGTSFIIEVPVS